MINIYELVELFGKPYNFDPNVSIEGVSIDSRESVKKKIFFAIKGRKVDAHTFLKEVFENGGVGAFIEDPSYLNLVNGKNIFLVDNVILALGKIAKYIIEKIGKEKKKIAITGSAGKTTTRYIINTILSKKIRTFTPVRNLNTEIGVPLSIFDIPFDVSALIFEFGADRPGDIAYLSELVKPNIGIITNIGPAHIERFGSLEEIANTKWALAEFLEKNNGVLIYNADDPILQRRGKAYKGRKIGFGRGEEANIKLVDYEDTYEGEIFSIYVNGNILKYRTRLFGISNIYNILAAFSLTYYLFPDDIEFIKNILYEILPVEGRLKPLKEKDFLIIDDTYNSNPLSLRHSLKVVSRFKKGKRIAVLGDMLELGELSRIYHRDIGRDIALFKWVDVVVGIGNYISFLIDGARDFGFKDAYYFDTEEKLLRFLADNKTPNSTYLFKASRGMKFERLIKRFREMLNG